jgi:hypothetical protein
MEQLTDASHSSGAMSQVQSNWISNLCCCPGAIKSVIEQKLGGWPAESATRGTRAQDSMPQLTVDNCSSNRDDAVHVSFVYCHA